MKRPITMLGAVLALALGTGAAAQGAGLEGIYYGLRTNLVSDHVQADYYTFLADGRVFRGDPSEGLGRPIDWERECHYAECGTYTRRGGEVRMRDRAGNETVFDVDGQGVLRRRGRRASFRRMHLLDGVRLDGAWGDVDEAEGDTLTLLRFSRDGRFSERGLLRRSAWAELGAPAEQRERRRVDSGSGTYTIRRGTLELRYDSGLTAYLLLVAPPGVNPLPAPATLFANRLRLHRLR